MKRVFLIAIISLTIFSCSKNSEQINVAKNEVEKRMSEIEKKDIKYTCIEISDREAYNEILKYHEKRQNKAQMKCDNFMEENELGKYQTIPLEEMSDSKLILNYKMMKLGVSICNEVSRHQKSCAKDLNILSKLKGKNTYYKILAVKTTPDTIVYTKTYLDNNNKIINTQYLK